MFFQNKKYKPWKKKDFVLSILQVVIHAIILLGLFAVETVLDKGGNGFIAFITDEKTLYNVVYAVVVVFSICTITYLYYFYEYRDFLTRAKNIAVLFISIELSFLLCIIMGHFSGIFTRPCTLCALLVLLLINHRSAVFVNLMFNTLLVSMDLLCQVDFEIARVLGSFITGVVTGHLAVYLVNNVGSRIKVFGMGFIIAIASSLFAFVFSLEPGLNILDVLFVIAQAFTSGLSSIVVLMALLPIFEYIFNMLTNYRLSEITDHKSKLISRLIEEAPGTFQHSLVVSTLAETCATAIGENPILARACAYYHDMGKLKQPDHFTENQHGSNPHDDLAPELSTQIIRDHATNGYDIIKKHHLPLILADVAREHHGTLPIQYFYNKALKYTEGDLDIKDFSYAGPKPSTKVSAIIMLADGCEAAVRAQNDRSRDKVAKVVNAIVEDRLKLEQFSDCDITMREIDIIRNSLIDSLSGVYHERVQYDKMKDKRFNMFDNSKKS